MTLQIDFLSTKPIDPEITMEKEWNDFWKNISTGQESLIQKAEMMKSFYAGAASMGFTMVQLAQQDDHESGLIADRLFEEIKTFFENLTHAYKTIRGEQTE